MNGRTHFRKGSALLCIPGVWAFFLAQTKSAHSQGAGSTREGTPEQPLQKPAVGYLLFAVRGALDDCRVRPRKALTKYLSSSVCYAPEGCFMLNVPSHCIAVQHYLEGSCIGQACFGLWLRHDNSNQPGQPAWWTPDSFLFAGQPSKLPGS